jgi:hypothetical protein
VGPAQVRQIAAIEDPVRRNLWITLAYHDLTLGMRTVVGAPDLGWTAFATWASRQAGVSIRGEQLSDLLASVLRASAEYAELERRLARTGLARLFDADALVAGLLGDAAARMRESIAAGNRTVFEELGPIFAGAISALGGQGRPDPARRAAFLATVQALDPADTAATARLREAFAAYEASRVVPAPERAELVLLANGLIGLTEQIRLQGHIQEALDAVVETALVERLRGRLGPLVPRDLLEELAAAIARAWRRAVTRLLLTLRTPGVVLDLSDDAPAAAPGRRFPADLAAPRSPALVAFLAAHDRTGGTGAPSGARDWASLADRMNYIVNLFRAWQQRTALLEPPFGPDQVAALEQGGVPGPPL